MKKKIKVKVMVVLLSMALLLSTTGIYSALAVAAGEYTSASSSTTSAAATDSSTTTQETTNSANVEQDGGKLNLDTQPDVKTEGGDVTDKGTLSQGDGTKENPYKILTVADLLDMQKTVNDVESKNKYFELDANIDLSSIAYSDFSSNSLYKGSLISVSKNLSASNPSSVYMNFNGNGYKLYGLNVVNTDSTGFALFGYLSSNSTVENLIISDFNIESQAESASFVSVFNAENSGTVKNIKVLKSNIKVSGGCKYAAFTVAKNNGSVYSADVSSSSIYASDKNACLNASGVVGINDGIISDCSYTGSVKNTQTVTSADCDILSNGNVGGIAAINFKTIVSSYVKNIGAYFNNDNAAASNAVFGGIAGINGGTVSKCVATGSTQGGSKGSAIGGIIGTPYKKSGKYVSVLTENYALVKISSSVSDCGAVIGLNGNADMMKDCYWSSKISNVAASASTSGTGVNDLTQGTALVTVNAGSSADINKSDIADTFGTSTLSVDASSYAAKGNISLKNSDTKLSVSGDNADTVGYISYSLNIKFPSEVGSEESDLTIAQSMNTVVFVLPDGTLGNGADQNSPLCISNSTELNMIRYAPFASYKLADDIQMPEGWTPFDFYGNLDGNGHSITADAPIFTGVYGSMNGSFINTEIKAPKLNFGVISDLKVSLVKSVSTAVFGNSCSARLNNIKLYSDSADAKLIVNTSSTGAFLNKILGTSYISNCFVNVPVYITSEAQRKIGGFAGIVNSEGSLIENCGSNSNVTANYKSSHSEIASFIGNVANNGYGKIDGCYASGKVEAGNYILVGAAETNLNIDKCTWSISDKAQKSQKGIDESKFAQLIKNGNITEWSFDTVSQGKAFISGKGSNIAIKLPSAIKAAASDDFSVSYNSKELYVNSGSITVIGGMAYVPVSPAQGITTVVNSEFTLINKTSGLVARVSVSNGLAKDSDGYYIISYAADLKYLSENLASFKDAKLKLCNDIDMSEVENFMPIGSQSAAVFSGVFTSDPSSKEIYSISNLSLSSTAKVGLFTALSGAKVSNIKFVSAKVNAGDNNSAVLAGQIDKGTEVSGVSFEKCKVVSSSLYSALLAGCVNDKAEISNISINNCNVNVKQNFAGLVVGAVKGAAAIKNITVENSTVNGSQYVGGIAGMTDTADSISEISDVTVKSSNISGITNVGGIFGSASDSTKIKNISITASAITASTDNANVAGGVAGSSGADVDTFSLTDTSVTGNVAGGVAGSTIASSGIEIKNIKLSSSKVISKNIGFAGSVIGACVPLTQSVEISDCSVSSDSSVSGDFVTGGIVGDNSGNALTIKNSTSSAIVSGSSEKQTGSATAGVVARMNSASINSLLIADVNVGGKITGNDCTSGLIGRVVSSDAFTKSSAVAADCVVSADISSLSSDGDDTTAFIIASCEGSVLTNASIKKAFNNIVFSTYASDASAYGKKTGFSSYESAKDTYYDMDNPGGKSVFAEPSSLDSSETTEIKINNLPSSDLFSFNAGKGWSSSSDGIISVKTLTESSVSAKAEYSGEISAVAEYVLKSNKQITLKVHFGITAQIPVKLSGNGTKESPYLITNAKELEAVADYDASGVYFALTNDISFTAADFEFGGDFYNEGRLFAPIGNEVSAFKGNFTGLYNSKIHSISGIRQTDLTFGGLFGAADGATISDLIISDFNITSKIYSACLVGSAVNTDISNITVKNSSTQATETVSAAGALAAYAEGSAITGIKVENCFVKAPTEYSSQGLSNAGAIAGVASGKISSAEVSSVNVKASNSAGGIVGKTIDAETLSIDNSSVISNSIIASALNAGGIIGVADSKVSVSSCRTDASVKTADYSYKNSAGGLIGSAASIEYVNISDVNVAGEVSGYEYAGGIIGSVNGGTASEITDAVVSNIVIAAKINSVKGYTGAVAGKSADGVFTDDKNSLVFKNIYYSSYQNKNIKMFADEYIDAYQSAGYLAALVDLNKVYYEDSGKKLNNISIGKDYIELNSNNIIIDSDINGDFKKFTVNDSIEFVLQNISSNNESLLTYNKATSSVKAEETSSNGDVMEFTYNNGIVLAIPLNSVKNMSGKGTKSEPYLISSAELLTLLAAYPNSYFEQTKDITFADGYNWSPVESFAGNYNGNGYKINNLHISDKTKSAGLVSVLSDGASISNVVFSGADVAGSENVGVVAGEAEGSSQIKNVSVISSKVSGKNFVGGIVGISNGTGAVINNCTLSSSSVKASGDASYAGGISGSAYSVEASVVSSSTINAYAAGGIIAKANIGGSETNIKNCKVTAATSVEAVNSAAGIIAQSDESSLAVDINGCEVDSTVAVESKKSAAGIIANVQSVKTVSISNSEVYAQVSANGTDSSAGGIIAYIAASAALPRINSCVASGKISALGTGSSEAGVAARVENDLSEADSYFIKNTVSSAVLSESADKTAKLVASFNVKPNDSSTFGELFNGNIISSYPQNIDPFEKAIMQYQFVAGYNDINADNFLVKMNGEYSDTAVLVTGEANIISAKVNKNNISAGINTLSVSDVPFTLSSQSKMLMSYKENSDNTYQLTITPSKNFAGEKLILNYNYGISTAVNLLTDGAALEGEGTKSNPYKISSAEDLSLIGIYPLSSYYEQTKDIKLSANNSASQSSDESSNGFTPIKDFSGVYDGNSYVISGLYVNTDDDYAGLFANAIGNAQLKNIHIEILDDAAGYGYSGVKGNKYAGGLVGYYASASPIVNCSVAGSTVSASGAAGGLVGVLASANIEGCFANTSSASSNGFAGGLVGEVQGSSSIAKSFTASSASSVSSNAGALIGALTSGAKLSISDVSVTGSALSNKKENASLSVGYESADAVYVAVKSVFAGGTNSSKASKFTVLSAGNDNIADVVYDSSVLGTSQQSSEKAYSTAQLISGSDIDGSLSSTWKYESGLYPRLNMNDNYSNSYAKIAAMPVYANSLETDVESGFTYPASIDDNIDGQKVNVTISSLQSDTQSYPSSYDKALEGNGSSKACDLLLKYNNGKINLYRNIFNSETPFITISSDVNGVAVSRVINIPQKSEADVYYISTERQLRAISDNEASTSKFAAFSKINNNSKARVVLTTDINLSSESFIPLENFKGAFEGNGFAINGLTVNSQEKAALFKEINGSASSVASVSNLKLTNVNISGGTDSAALAGSANAYTAVSGCYVSGAIHSTYYAGALIGSIAGGKVTSSSANATVTGTNVIGGLIGLSGAKVENCSSNGTVTVSFESNASFKLYGAGGLIGVMNNGSVSNSYFGGTVKLLQQIRNNDIFSASYGVGGLVGNQASADSDYAISSSYSYGKLIADEIGSADMKNNKAYLGFGGLTGVSNNKITASYSAMYVSTMFNAETTASGNGKAISATGGLVGISFDNVTDSYASGSIVGRFSPKCLTGGVIGCAVSGENSNLYFDKSAQNRAKLTAIGGCPNSNKVNGVITSMLLSSSASKLGLSGKWGFTDNAYPYLKASFNKTDSSQKANAVLSIAAIIPNSSDTSAHVGKGITKAAQLPNSIKVNGEEFMLTWSAVKNASIASNNAQPSLGDDNSYMQLNLKLNSYSVSTDFVRLVGSNINDGTLIPENSDEVGIEYTLENNSGDNLDNEKIGILIKSSLTNSNVITSDFYTSVNAKVNVIDDIPVTSGAIYVSQDIKQGYKIEVTAQNENGDELEVNDSNGDAYRISLSGSKKVKLKLVIVKADIPWGFRSIWKSIEEIND